MSTPGLAVTEDVHHRCQPDHNRRTVEIAEWRLHPERLSATIDLFKSICSDKAVGLVPENGSREVEL